MHKRALLVGALLVSSGAAYAEGVAVGAKVSTLGMGVELTKSFTENINGRLGYNKWSFDRTGTEDGVTYDIDVGLQTVGAAIDWYVFSGSFRVTGGLMSNGNEIDLAGTPTENVEIGDEIYSPAELGTVAGTVDFKSTAPYLGIGWGNPVADDKGFGFTFDLGVMFQGSPNVELTADGTLASDADFLAELAKEEANLESDLENLKLWPVAAFGISYQF